MGVNNKKNLINISITKLLACSVTFRVVGVRLTRTHTHTHKQRDRETVKEWERP